MEDLADPEVVAPGPRLRAPGARVLVLNASYEPINVCTVRRAAVLVLKSRAELLERGEGWLHSEKLELERPCVIRLIRYVRIPRDVHRRKITRKAVLARDAYTCQYCGHEASGLTVDHVIPRSRGGQSVWENIVAACAPCNRRKGNRMPREASMVPASRPRPPGPDRVHQDRGAEGPGRLGAVPGRRLTLGRPRKRRAAPIARGGPSKVRIVEPVPDLRGRVGLVPASGSPPVPGVGFRQAARTPPVRFDGHPPSGRSCRLAAPHLQRPEKTVTQFRTTSFLW